MSVTKDQPFKFGAISTQDGDNPTVEELGEAISDDFTERTVEEHPTLDEDVSYMEKGRGEHYETDREDYNFCYFTYVADTPESFRVRTEDGDEGPGGEVILETADVIYFENGVFAMRSRDDIVDQWIPQFIGKRTDTDLSVDEYSIATSIGQDYLKSAYADADIVSKISFGAPDADGSSEFGDGAEIIQFLAQQSDGLTFSTGQGDGNLKSDEVQTLVNSLPIKNINISQGDENREILKSSGRIQISWNESDWGTDETPRNRGQTIRSKLRPHLDSILS